jgi:hypothetical protein
LSLLAAGGVHTPTELASDLGVSGSLLEQMLADLSHMGYLRPVSNPTCPTVPNGHSTHYIGQSAHCAQCPLSSTCAVVGPDARVWTLTDKALLWAEEVARS